MSALFIVDDAEHERFRAEAAALAAKIVELPDLRPMESDVHELRHRGLHRRAS